MRRSTRARHSQLHWNYRVAITLHCIADSQLHWNYRVAEELYIGMEAVAKLIAHRQLSSIRQECSRFKECWKRMKSLCEHTSIILFQISEQAPS